MIFYIMGKSASGKDTVYKKLLTSGLNLQKVAIYTTRPLRDGEVDGVEYHFVDKNYIEKHKDILIEKRVYHTVFGDWIYATLDDGTIRDDNHYLMIGTLESYNILKNYFGEKKLFPIFLEVDEETLRERAVIREKMQSVPKFDEMERRLKADLIDFSEEKIKNAGIDKRYINDNFDECFERILKDVRMKIND